MKYRSVEEMAAEGKKVFVRLDLNVPLSNGVIQDDTRIRAALPTLRNLLKRGAAVIACSHLGRPKGKVVPELSMAPVAERLRELLPERKVLLSHDVAGTDAKRLAGNLKGGEVLLLENVRFEAGETSGDEGLADRLRSLADAYVNDAFGTIHRAHVSVCALPRKFAEAGVGLLMEKELKFLGGLLSNPSRPYTAFLGGAKVSDKIPVLRGLLKTADTICIGGAMAYTFLKAEGYSTGQSLVQEDLVETCADLRRQSLSAGVELLLPVDHRAAPSLEIPEPVSVESMNAFPENLTALDIGPKTSSAYSLLAGESETIFWNGPMGVFERPPFDTGTMEIARAVAAAKGVSVIGGGDSVAAVKAAGVEKEITHISTGGGASLALISGEALPGLEALKK